MNSSDTATAPAPGGTATLAGHQVARIGFGVMQLAEHRPGRQPIDRDAAIAILRTAVASGINHLDTADFYGTNAANANDLIRAALHPYPESLVLATKVGAERDAAGALVPAQRPEQLRAGVEANLARLGAERLAVVNLRRVDAAPGIIAEGDQIVDLDSQLAELVALRDAGKVDGIGLSNVSVDQLRQALPAGIACVQNSHSPVDRAAEPVLDLCRKHDIAWVPFCPLGSAFPQWPKVADQPAVRDAAEALGVTSIQVGLAWHLAHYAHTLLIAGTADPAHLAENIAAGDVRLDSGTRAALDAITVPPPS
ncbi:aldo/keto reductase [Catenulispora acidiphila DSM 44928]|uniref:Aldo/keto reductase n=1 Tax=Catenulispora acidiphila (strain DSM 44928 / JCM 14897 / NBRC 102108 / NRRL B-24433 / ID139908) TaxID=479433 RepID=C7Q529_CATAD|nr:aldo/keto reductase [Catenulispora acidiphila]ACU73977.1 aldo/keto reductase [Catenulispora acidiphila DSM 44928]